MLLLSHPTGNANVRAVARAFLTAGWLSEFDSCICWDPNSFASHLLPTGLARQLARRSFADVPLALQHSSPWRELFRLFVTGRSLPWLTRHELGPFSIDAVYRSFDRHVAARLHDLPGLQGVYAYEDGALKTFQTAERLGLHRVYDLPIGYWRSGQQIFRDERELQPAWACTLSGLNNSITKLERKDQELQLAELIVVPSQFVRSTLLEHHNDLAPIVVIPFGSPPALPDPPPTPAAGPLRVLFVGSLGQRKGLSYALDAVKALGGQVNLTLIGRITAPNCTPLLSALEQHRWIETLPHNLILEQMRHHDVLVLPSLFEGFALVIGEALSQGLPVICTTHSGAAEVIRDSLEGFVVPIRDSESIAERLQQLADDRLMLASMRQACLRRSRELSWSAYERGLCDVIGPFFTLPSPQS